MHVLDRLIQEHREAEQLVAQLSDTEPGEERRRILDELMEALHTHMAVEEEFLYPLVARDVEEDDAVEAENEHDLLRQALQSAQDLADQPGFDAAVKMITTAMTHHVHEEESEVFPHLRESDAAVELDEMDPDDLEARVDGGSGRTGGESRDELYRRAQEADIPGRSSMTKDELREALEHR